MAKKIKPENGVWGAAVLSEGRVGREAVTGDSGARYPHRPPAAGSVGGSKLSAESLPGNWPR